MRRVVLFAGLSLAMAAPAAADRGSAGSIPPPDDSGAYIAHIVSATQVRSEAGGGERTGRLSTRARWGRGTVKLLVLESKLAEDGSEWLRVRLPDRPNDASGWVDADRARVFRTPWRVVIDLSQRKVTVYRDGKVADRFRAVIGARSTPTPTGEFAISERIRQPGSSVLGPWALHLTAHSRVLRNYGGGPGRVAIHGRAGPLRSDPLGSAASHGCVRIPNRRVRWLARAAHEGTPVTIEP
jgi:lipoprotein-anchoring transpeptidase ErfK/SrfK